MSSLLSTWMLEMAALCSYTTSWLCFMPSTFLSVLISPGRSHRTSRPYWQPTMILPSWTVAHRTCNSTQSSSQLRNNSRNSRSWSVTIFNIRESDYIIMTSSYFPSLDASCIITCTFSMDIHRNLVKPTSTIGHSGLIFFLSFEQKIKLTLHARR